MVGAVCGVLTWWAALLLAPLQGTRPAIDPPPREAPIQVYLVAGQSNAVGRTDANDLPPELYTPQPDILFWFDEDHLDPNQRINSGHEWIPLQFQTGRSGNDFFGPEITLGRTLADARPTREVAVVKFAVGGTSLAYDWDPNRPGSLYEQMISVVEDALTTLTDDLGRPAELAGVVWMQGESDALNQQYATAYQANLSEFITSLRTDLGTPALPVVLGRISVRLGFPYQDQVRTAQLAVASADAGVRWINTDDLLLRADNIHFTGQSQMTLGVRFANAVARLPRVAEPRP